MFIMWMGSCFSSTFVVKDFFKFFRLSSMFLFSFSMSCFRFSLSVIVMISLDTADVLVVPALSFTVGPMV